MFEKKKKIKKKKKELSSRAWTLKYVNIYVLQNFHIQEVKTEKCKQVKAKKLQIAARSELRALFDTREAERESGRNHYCLPLMTQAKPLRISAFLKGIYKLCMIHIFRNHSSQLIKWRIHCKSFGGQPWNHLTYITKEKKLDIIVIKYTNILSLRNFRNNYTS